MAESYRTGAGVQKDPVKAVQWFRRAAEKGHAGAQYWLAESYRKGEGVAKDVAKAAEWYSRAAQQGHNVAREKLEQLGGSI